MTRFLLDTNIISNVIKAVPSASLIDWMSRQTDGDLFISVLTIAEIRRGILDMPAGRKQRELEAWFGGPEGPPALFAGRILSFDELAAWEWADLMAAGKATGQPRSAMDMMVAAIARIHGCVVVTDNERHFRGAIDFINPVRDGPI